MILVQQNHLARLTSGDELPGIRPELEPRRTEP